MCHTDADAVFRLARQVQTLSPEASVLLRHDQDDYITADQARDVGAHLLRSDIKVVWGGWSMTQAVMEAFAEARELGADYYVLITGQDYPIRHLADWEREVAGSGADALIGEMEQSLNPDLYRYKWREPFLAPRWVPVVVDRAAAYLWSRHVGRLLRPAVIAYRNGRDHRWALGRRRLSLAFGKEPPIPLVNGSGWMTLSAQALDRVLLLHRRDSEVRRFFETTRVADEMYIASLVHGQADLRVLRRPTSYARFLGDTPSPVWVDVAELVQARQTQAAFVRKVSATADDVRDTADVLTAGTGRSDG